MSTIDKVDNAQVVYHSIRETAKITGISQYYIRNLVRDKKIPGVYCGKKFLVNVPSFLEYMETQGEGVIANG